MFQTTGGRQWHTTTVIGFCVLFASESIYWLTVSLAADAEIKPEIRAVHRERLKERDAFKLEFQKHRQAGKVAEAIDVSKRILEIEREVYGNEHDEVLSTMEGLAQSQIDADDLASARRTREEILEIRLKICGLDHWHTTDARLKLEHVKLLEKLPPSDRLEVLQAKVLNSLAERFVSMGQYAAAEPLFQQALSIRKTKLGEEHPDYAISLNNLAGLYDLRADYPKAEMLFRQSLEIRQKILGEKHPDFATSLNNLAFVNMAMGDSSKAEPLFQRALEVNRTVLGPSHPNYATSLNNLAALYRSKSEYSKAEQLYQDVLEIRQKLLGKSHSDYATSLNNLAVLYSEIGEYGKAEPLFLQALEVKQLVFGEAHSVYANGLSNLAELYHSMAEFGKAETLFRQALKINLNALGEDHPSYATSLSNFAGLLSEMGDHVSAEPLYRKALDTRKKALGEKHPDYAMSLNNLAWLYMAMGNSDKAEPLFLQALEINKTALGEKHSGYATSLNNLAELYATKEEFGKAEALYQQALEVRKSVHGEAHPSYATALSNLAMLYMSMRKESKAEPLLRQVLAIQAAALGKQHPSYAASLSNLAGLYELIGEHLQAETLVREAVSITRRHVELTAEVQSERQQLVMARANRGMLSMYLTIAVASGQHTKDVYQEVLLAKGAVWRRQRMVREAQLDPHLEPLFNELRSVSTRRSQYTLKIPNSTSKDALRQQINQLTQRQEELERDLSNRSVRYREAQHRITVDEVRKSLPANHALVDFWEYAHLLPPDQGKESPPRFESRLVAFILRPDQPSITMIPIGAVNPLVELIDKWRRQTVGQLPEASHTGQLLRERLWLPLEPHLKEAKTILISPDGALGKFPFIALPGNTPESYLLEQYAFANIPVPQAMFSMAVDKDTHVPTVMGNLLELGDVDYDSLPDPQSQAAPKKKFGRHPASVRGDGWRGWEPLQATRGEIASIEKLFRNIYGSNGLTVLEKSQASETRFRLEAPRHKSLHLATHGFFAPEIFSSSLKNSVGIGSDFNDSAMSLGISGYPAGLLSGVVLAGANHALESENDDGILSALEVQTLDLRGVELVVLSACETGLGEVAGGEGLLGLQRAFQISGARSVVATLWQVSDDATRSLMERFYENLWRKELSPLEALREAQIWMMNQKQYRGLVRTDQPKPDEKPMRTPPFFWAAFVLSGDWR